MLKKLSRSRLSAGIFQAAFMLIAALAGAFLPLLFPQWSAQLKILLQWILLPLCGAFSAGVFAYSGVSQYAAWLMPPVIVSALPWLLIGYPVAPGVMLLCCLLSMFGAATGEVALKRSR